MMMIYLKAIKQRNIWTSLNKIKVTLGFCTKESAFKGFFTVKLFWYSEDRNAELLGGPKPDL